MPTIAISYRRADSAAIAGRISDRLVAHYGRDSVFMDIDNIPEGADFRVQITDILSKSDVVLALVGRQWVGERSKNWWGGRTKSRIHDEGDLVRFEVQTALDN